MRLFRKRVGLFGIFFLLTILFINDVQPSEAAVNYDRDAALTWACSNSGNYNTDPVRGNFRDPFAFYGEDYGRYSPTYIANMLDAGDADISGGSPFSIVGIHQIQAAMNPTWMEIRNSLAELEPGDFLFFSSNAGINASNWSSSTFHHAAIYVGTACGGAANSIATWNNERMNITEGDVTIVGTPGLPKQSTLYVHVLDNTPPPMPNFSNPLPGPSNVGLQPTFNFSQAPDADGDAITIHVMFGTSGGTLIELTPALAETATSYTLPYSSWGGSYSPGTSYDFELIADDGTETSPSGRYTFTTSYQPTPPTSFTPVNDATNVSIDTQLTWAGANDADVGAELAYTVRFAANPSPGSTPSYSALPVIDTTDQITSNPPDENPPRLVAIGEGLMPNTEYCWHITVNDEHGVTNDTAPVNCFITTYVATPTNLRLGDNSLDSITLRWADTTDPLVSNETGFYLEYSLTNNGTDWAGLPTNHPSHPTIANTTSLTHIGLICETAYFHRIRAYRGSDDLYSNYSNTSTTNTRPCAFPGVELELPEDGTVILPVDAMPEFVFLAGYLATDYKIVIRNLSGGNVYETEWFSEAAYCLNNICEVDIDDFASFPGLTYGEYTWEILAKYLQREAPTERRRFSYTPYNVPETISPAGTQTDTRGDLIYRWTDTGADEYRLTINNGTTQIGPIVVVSNSNCSAGECSYKPSDTNPIFYLRTGIDYNWTVAAAGSLGVSAASERQAFNLVSTIALTAPVMISPNGSTEDATPIFVFQPHPIANEYEIAIYRGTTLLSTIRSIYHNQYCDAVDCEFEFPANRALRNGTTYTWTVRVANSPSGVSAWATPRFPFTVTDSIPPDPILVSPDDGLELNTSRPEFVWQVADGALSYSLRIYRGTSLWKPAFPVDLSHCDLIECRYTLTIDLPEDTNNLVWEIVATNFAGTSTSEQRDFSTNYLPESITLITPTIGDTLENSLVELTWGWDSRIISYRLKLFRVGNSSPFFNQLIDCFASDCSHSIELADGNYDWQVEISVGTTVVRSLKQRFIVDAIPNSITLSSPIDNLSTNTLTPDFVWEADERLVRYELLLVKSTNNQQMIEPISLNAVDVCDSTSCHYDLAIAGIKIPNSGAMRWTIIGYTTDESSVQSSETFVIQNILPTSITLMNPDNGFVSSLNTLSIEWSYDSRVEAYTVYLSKPDSTVEEILVTSCTGSCSHLVNLEMIGTYRWYVVGSKAGFNETVTSTTRTFSYQSASGLPTSLRLYRPTNTSNISDLDPRLEWYHAAAVEEYRLSLVEISSDTEIYNSDWQSAASLGCASFCSLDMGTMGALLPNLGRYRWLIEGRNSSSSDISASLPWIFNLQNPLTTITLLRPGSATGSVLNPATIDPTFVWRNNPVYDQYTLRLYDTNNVLLYSTDWQNVTPINCPSDCEWSLSALDGFLLPANSRYFWTVEGRRNGFNGTRLSGRFNFTLRNYAPVIALELPVINHRYNGPSPAPVYSWTHNPIYSSYDLVLFNGTREIWRNVSPIDAATYCATSCVFDFGLEGEVIPEAGTTLKWQVFGYIENFADAGSSVQRAFSAVNLSPSARPDLNAPVNNTFIYHPDVTEFVWEDVGFDNYYLYVRQGTSGVNIIHQLPYDADTYCDGTTCRVTPSIEFINIMAAHSWSVIGAQDGMNPNSTHRSDWLTINVQMLPLTSQLELQAPRQTVTLIDPVFFWERDVQNRIDHYLIEVYRVNGNNTTTLIKTVDITDVSTVCPADDLAIEHPNNYCGLVISNEELQFQHNGNYRWRLIGSRLEYPTELITVGPASFTMSIRPPVPVLLLPNDRYEVDITLSPNNLIFKWEGDLSGRVAEYELRIYSSSNQLLTTPTAHNRFIADDIDPISGICTFNYIGGVGSVSCEVSLARLETIRPLTNEVIEWEVAAINSAFRDENAVVSARRTVSLLGNFGGTQSLPNSMTLLNVNPVNSPIATIELSTTPELTEATSTPEVTEAPSAEATSTAEITQVPSVTPELTVTADTTPEVTELPSIVPSVTDTVVPTATIEPTVTVTESPTAIPSPTPVPTLAPIPATPVIRQTLHGFSTTGLSHRLSFELCSDSSYMYCEPVNLILDLSTGVVILPSEQLDVVGVYEFNIGSYPNLQLSSLSYTTTGLEILP